jgi:hypothetical protein
MVVVVAFTAAAFAVVASATLMAQVVQHVLNLKVGGIAVLQHNAGKLQGTACQRMVGVNSHTVFLNLCYASHKAVLFFLVN